ncbi:hypothetical protein BEP19_10230 [Ammoniphilus oxalaticus]|uniref:General stress protein 17M-like domain-containing protein n=1 Tax=Ammoniphilus oxalaticus TaxID=66863 RepID=A0A419SFS7_9BACL|nr:general stress protein [Ammoniphilus oxalaticus]RKD22629.1 hypothetical protein BEP19_10230 [Ammoniphilus oxalaticus]
MEIPVAIVENGVEAVEEIRKLESEGYSLQDIYILAHSERRTNTLTDAIETNSIGILEQGIFNQIANIFRSREDELCSQMESMGIPKEIEKHLLKELNQGRLLIIAQPSEPDDPYHFYPLM